LGIAAGSAAAWAVFDLCLYALRAHRTQDVVGATTAAGAVVCGALAGFTGQRFATGAQAAKVLGLGAASLGVVDTLINLSMRQVGAGRAALLFSAVNLASGVASSWAMNEGHFTALVGASLGVALVGSAILATDHFADRAHDLPQAADANVLRALLLRPAHLLLGPFHRRAYIAK
jgi:drug/metabolite transporter (DMT)-like permease